MDNLHKSYYAIIPATVRYDNELPPNTKLLYGEITALANERGYCWASNDYFAKLFNVDKKTVSNWVNLLVKKNYIVSEIIYKDNTKVIEERRLFIAPPTHKKMESLPTKSWRAYPQKNGEPIHEIMEDNNTFNNTMNNTLNISSLSLITNNQENARERKKEDEDDKKIVFDFYQQNFGMLTPYTIQQLDYWIEDLSPVLVKLALEKTIMNNVKNFNYANRILLDWKQKNVKTVEDVQALEIEHQNKTTKKSTKTSNMSNHDFGVTRY